VCYVWV